MTDVAYELARDRALGTLNDIDEEGAPRIHPGAEVSSGASVDAASVIGPRAIVEEGCRLRECVVWPGARVPAGTCAERRIFHLSL